MLVEWRVWRGWPGAGGGPALRKGGREGGAGGRADGAGSCFWVQSNLRHCFAAKRYKLAVSLSAVADRLTESARRRQTD